MYFVFSLKYEYNYTYVCVSVFTVLRTGKCAQIMRCWSSNIGQGLLQS